MKTYHLPTKPLSLIDTINRVWLAQGSMRAVAAGSDADFNGHWINMSFNDYRGYYVAEYTWAGRNVVARGSVEVVLPAAIEEYKRTGRGGSLHVFLKDEDAHVAAQFGLIEGEEPKEMPWYTWKHKLVGDAMWKEKHFAIPATAWLLEASTEEEYNQRYKDEMAIRHTRT